ncbi:MAG: Flp family type IVb pilin [Caldilineaceae bacterium]
MNALTSLYVYLMSYLHRDEGQDFIEYALIIVLIVIAAIVGMTAVGGRISEIWDTIVTSLSPA